VRLARFELRRLTRGRLTAAALAVLVVIPLLYGALYLSAFWDPYGNLDRIPVALVNEDKPAKASDGSTVHAGADLAAELLDRHVFGWRVTDRTHALRGLAAGRYHLVFDIPPDFSADLAGNPDPAKAPAQGRLSVVDNDATNYLSGLLARSVFTEVRTAAEHSAAQRYFNAMLIGFTDLKSQTGQAADGAGQLAGGLASAGAGADQLRSGADRASAGAGQLAGGLAGAQQGADQLATGLAALDAGAAQLADGADQAAAGGALLRGKVDAAATTVEPVLRRNAALIQQAATAIAAGADTIASNVDALPALAGQARYQAQLVTKELDVLVAAHPELAGDPAVTAARAAAEAGAKAAGQIGTSLDRAGLDRLRTQMTQVAAAARQVAAAAPHLADDVAAARTQVDALAAGLDQLATGADQLHQGTSKARRGADALDGGLYRLATGARALDTGLGSLDAGARRLAGGLASLQGGADRLASGLASGAAKIPGYDPDRIAARSGVLGDPVALDRQVRNPAATYGVGFAPYFIALALWVGAMITYMVLRPINPRHALSGAPARRVALAGWLPAAALGLVQALLLFGVLRVGLDLAPVRPLATIGYLLLTAVTYTAIMQLIGARLGPAGRVVALALLMLQLTSSGGTYPVQTSPAFFRAIHPYLPMSYVVDGLRHLINGGPSGTVITGCLVLAGFAAAAFTGSVATARRARRLRPSGLHPELVM
jgi:putative membrane protein